ncbi:alpha/beta hydrolase [Arthrobacter bambusae]|uniref:alpha/beta fold hydrolase n=1 Tax=Arthrobacter TaxID=1663 RepID=UPI001F515658|nr:MULTISPECIES: alpha/beta hydrolase [Arthrobacter]MCI0141778.1 alpha/beta hydrolase [Arthrobacter bambusae]UYY83268.1 alpha/beta hydrolase [Arthrobacter sp. YA7-1]
MSVQQKNAPTLRRHVLPTELGPCMVRVQQGTHGPRAESGTPEVYLHGAAGSWTTFQSLLARATAHDRVLIDLPGWGESTAGARREQFSIEAMARAVVGVLSALGYRRWKLVGHSMGGFLALHMAAAWPEETAGVAAISATTFSVSDACGAPLRGLYKFPAFTGMLLAMRSMAALGAAGTAVVRTIATTPLMRPLMSPFFADPGAIPPAVLRELGDDARPGSHYDFGQWRGILCPVLAIRGDRDVFTPESDLARLAVVVPQTRLATFARCGHFAHIEQPDHVHRLIDELWSR